MVKWSFCVYICVYLCKNPRFAVYYALSERPNYDAGCWPQYCHDADWTPVNGPLEQEMYQYWNWCKDSVEEQEEEWEHEWWRHGT